MWRNMASGAQVMPAACRSAPSAAISVAVIGSRTRSPLNGALMCCMLMIARFFLVAAQFHGPVIRSDGAVAIFTRQWPMASTASID